jgi:predicted membrane protein
MSIQDQNSDDNRSRHGGRILAGLFLLLVGAVFLMKEMEFPFFPNWLFTWPMILIAIGIYTGIKHEFRNPGWIILIIIGGVFLTDEMNIGFDFHRFIIPIIIISVGFLMILRPRRNRDWSWDNWKQKNPSYTAENDIKKEYSQNYSSEDRFDSTSIFSGVKKIILSKNFRGGDITCFMGGFEADLSKADLQSPAIIDITHIFGGTKLIVPSNWLVKIDVVSLFAGVEDKRQQSLNTDPNKLLILKGTSIFGGIEIKSY